ncbi:uncharacterized protein LOC100443491 [Pongo abelii]|uniref:uncharacterized protein LOC100443491 n=1 Tax=Pongo abelii TaxID=9601 RepID=UPI00300575F3
MALLLSDWCPDGDADTRTGTDPGRTTQWLCAKEKGVRGTQPCPHIYLRLPAQNCEETRFCCASPRSVVLGHGAPRTASPPSALSHPSPPEGLSFSPFPPSALSHPSPPEGLSFSPFHCLCPGKLSESPGCFWNSLGWSFSVLTEPGVWKVGEATWVAENLAQPLTSPCACYLFFNYLDINSDLKHQFNIQIMLGLQLCQVAFLSRSQEASHPSCPPNLFTSLGEDGETVRAVYSQVTWDGSQDRELYKGHWCTEEQGVVLTRSICASGGQRERGHGGLGRLPRAEVKRRPPSQCTLGTSPPPCQLPPPPSPALKPLSLPSAPDTSMLFLRVGSLQVLLIPRPGRCALTEAQALSEAEGMRGGGASVLLA